MECNRNYSNYVNALKVLGLYIRDQRQGKHEVESFECDNKKIEQAYRRLARKHHPDRGGEEQSFVLLKAARDFLLSGGATDFHSATPSEWDSRAASSSGDNNDGSSEDFPSRVLLRGRSCVRDLATKHDKITRTTTVLAATDEGLRMVSSQRELRNASQESFNLEAVLCCEFSPDGRFAFAGTGTGQIHRYFFSSCCPDVGDSFKTSADEPLDNLIGYPLKQSTEFSEMFSAAKSKVTSVIVKDVFHSILSHRIGSQDQDKNQQIVFVACESPSAIAVLHFRSVSVETLWKISNSNGLDRSIDTIDALNVTKIVHFEEGKNAFNIWCGGSNSANEALLVAWEFDSDLETSTIASTTDEDVAWWSDSSNSDCSYHCNDELYVPCVTTTLGFGSVYSIDDCSVLGLLAVAVGTDVIILEDIDNNRGEIKSLKKKKTLITNHTLYCVKILSKDLQVAACGAGESITIWSLVSGTMSMNIRLDAPKHCNLSTNCIMALGCPEVESRSSIISGGYDGNVTLHHLSPGEENP